MWDWLALFRKRPAGSLGEQGEGWACRHLQKQGYRILGRQVKGRYGELDIIASQGQTIVFVEVKARSKTDHGHPADAVNRDKQSKLTRAALEFLKRHKLLDRRARFDVIAVTLDAAGEPQIEHFQNAFEPRDWGSFFS